MESWCSRVPQHRDDLHPLLGWKRHAQPIVLGVAARSRALAVSLRAARIDRAVASHLVASRHVLLVLPPRHVVACCIKAYRATTFVSRHVIPCHATHFLICQVVSFAVSPRLVCRPRRKTQTAGSNSAALHQAARALLLGLQRAPARGLANKTTTRTRTSNYQRIHTIHTRNIQPYNIQTQWGLTYICMCMYVYVYIYIYIHTYIQTYYY